MNFRDYTEIVFEAGDILSVQMLEETYRYPREFLHLTHANLSDGIICGLDFTPRSEGLYLTAGIVKIRGVYYILPKDVNMDEWLKQCKPTLTSGVTYSLCMVSDNVLTHDDKAHGIKLHSRVVLKAEKEMMEHSLLLAKYKFRPDVSIPLPKLETESENPFQEFFESGLLQVLECEYAHPKGGTTYPPLIFRAIQTYLEQKFPISPYDFSLLLELQNHGIVSTASLINYVKVNKTVALLYENMTREKLLREVCDCVQKHYVPIAYADPEVTPESIQETKSRRFSKLI